MYSPVWKNSSSSTKKLISFLGCHGENGLMANLWYMLKCQIFCIFWFHQFTKAAKITNVNPVVNHFLKLQKCEPRTFLSTLFSKVFFEIPIPSKVTNYVPDNNENENQNSSRASNNDTHTFVINKTHFGRVHRGLNFSTFTAFRPQID